MLGNDSFVCVASENVTSRSLWQCWAVVYWELCSEELRATCWGYTTWTRSSLLRSQGGDHHSCFTILLAVCLVLRRETSVFGPCFFCPKAQNTICVDIAQTLLYMIIHLVSVSSLDSRWFSFSPAGSVPWHLGMRASQRWASRLHSPCTAMVERSCEALRAALDVKCINPGTAPYQGWPRPDVVDFFCVKAVKVIKDDCCTF